jgi:hypothetical protein
VCTKANSITQGKTIQCLFKDKISGMKNDPHSKDTLSGEEAKVSTQTFLSTDLLGWLTNGISDGLAVIFQDRMILENDRFRHLIEYSPPHVSVTIHFAGQMI